MTIPPRLPQDRHQGLKYSSKNLKYTVGWGAAIMGSHFISEDITRDILYGFATFLVTGLGLRIAVLKDLAPRISFRGIAPLASAVGIAATVAFAAYGYRNAPQRPQAIQAQPSPATTPVFHP